MLARGPLAQDGRFGRDRASAPGKLHHRVQQQQPDDGGDGAAPAAPGAAAQHALLHPAAQRHGGGDVVGAHVRGHLPVPDPGDEEHGPDTLRGAPGVQSQGFMFNRIWAACKRETLAVLQEGVGQPAQIDALFRDFFHAEKGPCERMDEVGLDVVANIESHYIKQRPEISQSGEQPLEWLKKTYVDRGELGEKTGDGLFTWEEREELKAKHKLEKYPEVEEALGA